MLNSTISINFLSFCNILSAFFDTIGLLICFIFLCLIFYSYYRIKNRKTNQTSNNVIFILSINILCIIIIKITVQIIHVTIPIILQDFQFITNSQETFSCQFRAYIFYSMVGILYWNYVLLAFFRFVRVIYPLKLWLHQSFVYLYVLIPSIFLCVFISMLPILLIFDGIHLISNEVYCSVRLASIYSLILTAIISFTLPYTVMCIFYICITRKIQQMSMIRQCRIRNRRDYIVMRRILLNAIILFGVSLPVFVISIINMIYGHFDLLIYRVQWLSSSVSSCLFSFILPFTTVKLRQSFRTKSN
ncbi:hypothetical protein I4U23_022673 [Adineta vaga]|nr:hypothetical protein I4U23_022673 [Adineta vaga]